MKKISPVNPVARAMLLARRRAMVVAAKKGKGSYKRNKNKASLKNLQDDNN